MREPPKPEEGYALLLGPNFSIPLTHYYVRVGRKVQGAAGQDASDQCLSNHQKSPSGRSLKNRLVDMCTRLERLRYGVRAVATKGVRRGASRGTRASDEGADQVGGTGGRRAGQTRRALDCVCPLFAAFPSASLASGRLCDRIHSGVDVNLGPDPTVSKYHATISYDPGIEQWEITCHSKNGMMVNGRSVVPSDGPALLYSKSRIQIGCVVFFFLLPARCASGSGAIAASTQPPNLVVYEPEEEEASALDSPDLSRDAAESSSTASDSPPSRSRPFSTAIRPLPLVLPSGRRRWRLKKQRLRALDRTAHLSLGPAQTETAR